MGSWFFFVSRVKEQDAWDLRFQQCNQIKILFASILRVQNKNMIGSYNYIIRLYRRKYWDNCLNNSWELLKFWKLHFRISIALPIENNDRWRTIVHNCTQNTKISRKNLWEVITVWTCKSIGSGPRNTQVSIDFQIDLKKSKCCVNISKKLTYNRGHPKISALFIRLN